MIYGMSPKKKSYGTSRNYRSSHAQKWTNKICTRLQNTYTWLEPKLSFKTSVYYFLSGARYLPSTNTLLTSFAWFFFFVIMGVTCGSWRIAYSWQWRFECIVSCKNDACIESWNFGRKYIDELAKVVLASLQRGAPFPPMLALQTANIAHLIGVSRTRHTPWIPCHCLLVTHG